jgi:hypothetical protein
VDDSNVHLLTPHNVNNNLFSFGFFGGDSTRNTQNSLLIAHEIVIYLYLLFFGVMDCRWAVEKRQEIFFYVGVLKINRRRKLSSFSCRRIVVGFLKAKNLGRVKLI